jgi:4'-phosphopantetheinyl transferase EntD
MVSLTPEPSVGSKASLSVQHFRGEARRVRRDAERITGDAIRRQMLDVAAQYDVLAEGEERQPR